MFSLEKTVVTMSTTIIALELPTGLVKALDAELRRQKPKPLRMWDWVHKTPEGCSWWAQNERRLLYISMSDVRAIVKKEWESSTGGAQRGRPRLVNQRAEFVATLLKEHLNSLPPIEAPQPHSAQRYGWRQKSVEGGE